MPSSTHNSSSLWWIHYAHLFEGITMLLIGPFFMLKPALILSLYAVKHDTSIASDVVPWFGSLVTLMGYHQTLNYNKLTKSWIEGCLLADILWLYAFITFINKHGQWNIWSLVGSLTWTIVYAPLRVYWLWLVPIKYRPKKE